jgi:GNAT superfamily N-acetyltransferase
MTKTQTQKQSQPAIIREAGLNDLKTLWDLSAALRQSKDPDYFEIQLEYQKEGSRMILIASVDGVDVGYCILNWQPKYGYFRANKIPEIQDLNVLREFRKRGIGAQLITHCEEMARREGYSVMGISFGLDASFGAAQRLYVKMGYVPDGLGVTYDRKAVSSGEFKPVDDQLCLMMTKAL